MTDAFSQRIGTVEELTLRFRSFWKTVGALLIAFVVYESLTPYPIGIPVEQGDKYGHILAYATLMFWFGQLYEQRVPRIGWAVGFIAMGIGIEFLQRLTVYRTFEIFDMVVDAVGVCIGWLVSPPRIPNLLRYIETRWLKVARK